ncbi:MarR family transcriptional regulator [Paenibacillus thiaminolyticus]|uniref:MarR family winged helix-turn-helix transcriptional regulator n=1 Tax=Paenibacillus thiaminolyticus TaxID=49283 RepID=UPI00232CB0F4|nr:MarR family transcriptional regulator [Paenibacillus thiaminolyticus]WCF06612.1 MarR family transcriptional regulator [Paenibacillus thiaminolyticus]
MDKHKELYVIQQIYGTLFALANKLQTKGDAYLSSITSRQFMVMLAILHLPEGEATIINIANKLGTTKQSARQMISSLEQKGYIVAKPSQSDRRAVNISITDAGKEIMLKSGESSVSFFADLSQHFTLAEMEQLWILLKKLYRFDGEDQDGFEENVSLAMGREEEEMTKRALEQFSRQRAADAEPLVGKLNGIAKREGVEHDV